MSTASSKGVALITGASTGIGAIYADRLAKRGYDLILVARNKQRLDAVAAKLQAETGVQVTALPADLSDKAGLAKVEAVLREDANITMLVNNAGVGSVASILQADVDKMEAMIYLNITALTRLTYAAAPAFVARGKGTIINISSAVAIAVENLNGVYSASKTYVLSLGHSLQKDLAEKGVRVQTVLPAATATEFWDVAGYAPQKTSETTMRSDDLVDAALAGLDAGELVTIPALHEAEAWTRWEQERREMGAKFRNPKPAPRYQVANANPRARLIAGAPFSKANPMFFSRINSALAQVLGKVTPMSKGKVIVVMSSANALDLKDGKTYSTGYYLNEFVVPYRKLLEAGYEPVIANPKGDLPLMDANSNNAMFFGGDDAARADALKYAQDLELLKRPKTLASIVAEGTQGYVGLFIPGGHAPMVDLLKDRNLGKILKSFHDTGRPTGIVCHGPIVLLSALPDPESFLASMIAGDGKASSLNAGWPYAGYRLTVFATGEEQALEGPSGLGGYVQYYPVNALAEAGARVETIANWHPNVVVDRELITGQQPMSAPAFGDALVAKLKEHVGR